MGIRPRGSRPHLLCSWAPWCHGTDCTALLLGLLYLRRGWWYLWGWIPVWLCFFLQDPGHELSTAWRVTTATAGQHWRTGDITGPLWAE